MALQPYAVLEIAEAQKILGIPVGTDDDLIEVLINSYSRTVENNEYGPFIVQQFTEYHYGWRKNIRMRKQPIVSIDSITDPAGNVVLPTDYRIEPEIGNLVHWGRFPVAQEVNGMQSRWIIPFKAGRFGTYADPSSPSAAMLTSIANRKLVDQDVKISIAQLVGMVYERRTPDVLGVKVGDLSISYEGSFVRGEAPSDTEHWPKRVQLLLAPYKTTAII